MAQPIAESSSVIAKPPWTTPMGLYTDSSGSPSNTALPSSTSTPVKPSACVIGGGGSEGDDGRRVGDRQPERRDVRPGQAARRDRGRRLQALPALHQDPDAQQDQDRAAGDRQRPPAGDEGAGQGGDSERGDGRVET